MNRDDRRKRRIVDLGAAIDAAREETRPLSVGKVLEKTADTIKALNKSAQRCEHPFEKDSEGKIENDFTEQLSSLLEECAFSGKIHWAELRKNMSTMRRGDRALFPQRDLLFINNTPRARARAEAFNRPKTAIEHLYYSRALISGVLHPADKKAPLTGREYYTSVTHREPKAIQMIETPFFIALLCKDTDDFLLHHDAGERTPKEKIAIQEGTHIFPSLVPLVMIDANRSPQEIGRRLCAAETKILSSSIISSTLSELELPLKEAEVKSLLEQAQNAHKNIWEICASDLTISDEVVTSLENTSLMLNRALIAFFQLFFGNLEQYILERERREIPSTVLSCFVQGERSRMDSLGKSPSLTENEFRPLVEESLRTMVHMDIYTENIFGDVVRDIAQRREDLWQREAPRALKVLEQGEKRMGASPIEVADYFMTLPFQDWESASAIH